MKIKKEQVEKALAELEKGLAADGDLEKASSDDLDQPEGGELEPGHMKNKMSDKAPAPVKAKKSLAKDDTEETEEVSKGDEGGDDDLEQEEEQPMLQKNKKAKKSFSEELPEEIQTKIDVSEFLKSLVDHAGDSIDSLREYVAKSDVNHEARYTEVTEMVEDIQKSQAKIGIVLKAICERIGVIEAQPARAAKSDTVVKSEKTERQFASGLEEEKEEKMFKSLHENPVIAKSQMASALCDLVKKGEASDMDVIGFESGGYIRPELVTKLKTVLN